MPNCAREVRPFSFGRVDDATRIGEKGCARFLTIEEIEPLTDHDPDQRMSLDGSVAADRYRVITTKAGRVDLRVRSKGPPVAFIGEPPDDAIQIEFDLRGPKFRLALCKIGHRVKPADGEARVQIDRQLIVGRGPHRPGCKNTAAQGDPSDNRSDNRSNTSDIAASVAAVVQSWFSATLK